MPSNILAWYCPPHCPKYVAFIGRLMRRQKQASNFLHDSANIRHGLRSTRPGDDAKQLLTMALLSTARPSFDGHSIVADRRGSLLTCFRCEWSCDEAEQQAVRATSDAPVRCSRPSDPSRKRRTCIVDPPDRNSDQSPWEEPPSRRSGLPVPMCCSSEHCAPGRPSRPAWGPGTFLYCAPAAPPLWRQRGTTPWSGRCLRTGYEASFSSLVQVLRVVHIWTKLLFRNIFGFDHG